jgi:subtilisin family serine protease
MPVRVASLDADIADAIADGILFVTSAGNDSYKIDVTGGSDYNNVVTLAGSLVYYHRGSSPGAATGAICVGAIGTTGNEAKAAYSNTGPRVDIYAPGSGIISSVYDVGITSESGNYIKYDGTSMAAPQVTGVLACLLEIYPRMTQSEALAWLLQYAGTDRIGEVLGTGFTYSNYSWIQNGNNKYLYFKSPRESTGNVFPNLAYKPRPATGMLYPRPNIYKSL